MVDQAPELPALSDALSTTKSWRCGTLTYTTRGLVALFAWMLWGDFCFSLMETIVPSILPLKLKSLGAPNTVISLILTTLPGIFNISVCPWVSFKSDRYRSRWGRRLPFILLTMPFLTLSLVMIGFSDGIGFWIKNHFLQGHTVQLATVVIILLLLFAAAFDLFNMFVNTVYWYLFNDIVPQALMGRFMGYFKFVGSITGTLYNFFLFQYAESHMREIYLGVALLYLVGFGIMCLRVKEGEYPPVENAGHRPGFFENIRTYARECFTMRYYWDIFLMHSCQAMGNIISTVFNVFFLQSLGLTNNNIGKMTAVSSLTIPLCFLFAGNLVDRWHTVRVYAYIVGFQAFFVLNGWVWLFIDAPNPLLYAWIAVISGAFFGTPIQALKETSELTRLMKLLPREKYGQYCGTVAMVRSFTVMLAGVLAGLYIDLWSFAFPTGYFAYRFNFLWSGLFAILAFYFNYRTFRAWKRLGGTESYVPPTSPFKLSSLKPRPGDTGKVNRKLLLIAGLGFTGTLLSLLVWAGYYTVDRQSPTDLSMLNWSAWTWRWLVWVFDTFKAPIPYNAMIFYISAGVSIVLFMCYLRFVKFMERP